MKLPFIILSKKKYKELLSKSEKLEKDYNDKLKADVFRFTITGMCVAWSVLITHLKDHTWDKDLCDKLRNEFLEASRMKQAKELSWKLGQIKWGLEALFNNIYEKHKWFEQFKAMTDQIDKFLAALKEKTVENK